MLTTNKKQPFFSFLISSFQFFNAYYEQETTIFQFFNAYYEQETTIFQFFNAYYEQETTIKDEIIKDEIIYSLKMGLKKVFDHTFFAKIKVHSRLRIH
jgi:hypothetical protein